MTAIAQGTPASDFATKIARPELTNTPSSALTPISGGKKTTNPKATANPKVTKPKATPTDSDIEPTAVPPPLPKAKGAKLNSPEYSVQAFMWYRPEIADRDLNAIKDMGFGWVKQQFAWRDIEGVQKGELSIGAAPTMSFTRQIRRGLTFSLEWTTPPIGPRQAALILPAPRWVLPAVRKTGLTF